MKYKIYPKDCHGKIKADDCRNVQFENGTNFEKMEVKCFLSY